MIRDRWLKTNLDPETLMPSKSPGILISQLPKDPIMNFNTVKELSKICSEHNINISTASDDLLEFLLKKFGPANESKSTIQTATASTETIPVFQDWDQSKLTATPSNGVYKFHGRVVSRANQHDFSVVIKSQSNKVQAIPCSDNLHQRFFRPTRRLFRENVDQFFDKLNKNTYDTRDAIGEAHVEWDQNNIKKITDLRVSDWAGSPSKSPTSGKVIKQPRNMVVPTTVPIAVQRELVVPVNLSKKLGLDTFSVSIDKKDPALLNDIMLIAYMYNPSNTRNLPKETLGRIGEVIFNLKYKDLYWHNKGRNESDYYDFLHSSKISIDVKTTDHHKNNLLVEQKKVERNGMADFFALCVVIDEIDRFDVFCKGFMSKADILTYIGKYPGCLMGDTYKIKREFLSDSI